MTDGNRLELVSQTKSHFNQYIRQADKKSAILISGHLAFIGLLVNSTFWTNLECSKYIILGLSVFSVSAGIYTIFPRISNENDDATKLGNLNWQVVAESDRYKKSILDDNIEDGIESLAESNKALANVLKRKYIWLRISMLGTIGTVVTMFLAVL